MSNALATIVTTGGAPRRHHSTRAKTEWLVRDALNLHWDAADWEVREACAQAFAKEYRGGSPKTRYNSLCDARCVYEERLGPHILNIFACAAQMAPKGGRVHTLFLEYCRDARDYENGPAAWLREMRQDMAW